MIDGPAPGHEAADAVHALGLPSTGATVAASMGFGRCAWTRPRARRSGVIGQSLLLGQLRSIDVEAEGEDLIMTAWKAVAGIGEKALKKIEAGAAARPRCALPAARALLEDDRPPQAAAGAGLHHPADRIEEGSRYANREWTDATWNPPVVAAESAPAA